MSLTLSNKVRIVTAASLFDGHDAAINIMRRIMQAQGRRNYSPGPQPQRSRNEWVRHVKKMCRASPSPVTRAAM
ncbi:MAG: hypothetical protein R2765_09820 [Ferruginibacter sp.]